MSERHPPLSSLLALVALSVLDRNAFERHRSEERVVRDAQVWGGFSTFWAAIVSLITLAVLSVSAFIGLSTIAAQHREDAEQQYAQLLKFEADHPNFSTPGENAQAVPGYPAYVAYLLYSCERIFDTEGKDPAWRHACHDEISVHQVYLKTDRFARGYCSYSSDIRAEISGITGRSFGNCPL